MRSGRRSRAIYQVQVLHEAPELIRRRAEAGEHVRILAEVPAGSRSSAARRAMGEQFGSPTSGGWCCASRRGRRDDRDVRGAVGEGPAVPVLDGQRYNEGTGGQRLLLRQLAGGAKDEQIARALGLSVRTVRRRVAELLDELGADSRFQAGAEAVRRGWL